MKSIHKTKMQYIQPGLVYIQIRRIHCKTVYICVYMAGQSNVDNITIDTSSFITIPDVSVDRVG